MRTLNFIFGCILLTQFALAQKTVKKTLVNNDIKYIQINAENCFTVAIATYPGNELLIEASIEGEYKHDLAINLEENDSTIRVGATFLPNFNPPNDKLSAHKVISIKLLLKIPEYKDVRLYGTNSNVAASGNYKALQIVLSDGNCTLSEVSEKVAVKTQSGNIVLFAREGIINAKSTYGTVTSKSLKNGLATFALTSVEGDITVSYPK